jgi:hypothetical protein
LKTPNLTSDEKEFIESQGLKLSDFINANQKSIPSIQFKMYEENKSYAYNAIPCDKHRHRLRDRSDHCIQCSHANIGFRNHWYRTAYIYIAASKKYKLIKVGTTINKDTRIVEIRKSFKSPDWEILYSIYCEESGRLEYEVHSKLSRFLANDYYHHINHMQKTKEVFRCSFFKALSAVQSVLKENNINHEKGLYNVAFPNDYDFPNLSVNH